MGHLYSAPACLSVHLTFSIKTSRQPQVFFIQDPNGDKRMKQSLKQHMDTSSTQPPTALTATIVWWRWRCCLLRRSFLKPVRATCTSLNPAPSFPSPTFFLRSEVTGVAAQPKSLRSSAVFETNFCSWTLEHLRHLRPETCVYCLFTIIISHSDQIITKLQQPTSKGGCEHWAAEASCQSHGIWSLSTGDTGCECAPQLLYQLWIGLKS